MLQNEIYDELKKIKKKVTVDYLLHCDCCKGKRDAQVHRALQGLYRFGFVNYEYGIGHKKSWWVIK